MHFCTRAKPLELTSIPFCTRAKSHGTNFKAFLHTCKTTMQTFNALLHTAQNRPANVQSLIVHDAKPSCKRSMSDCLHCKSSRKNFRGWLFMAQDCYASVQCLIVDIVKLHCLAWEFSLCIWDSFFPLWTLVYLCANKVFCHGIFIAWSCLFENMKGLMWIIFF